jgi:hypothetical protein
VNDPLQHITGEKLAKIANDAAKAPGIYLMALRSHMQKGQKILGSILDSVAETLPSQDTPADLFNQQKIAD